MNEELKQIFKKNNFKPVIFDGNKYKTHIDAFINNDFKVLNSESASDYQESLDNYTLFSESISKSNELTNQNIKFVVPLYHLNTHNYSFYEFYLSNYEDETLVMKNFFIFLFETFGDELVYKNSKSLKEQILELQEDPECFFHNVLFEDYLGNITLNGQSLFYYFNLIIQKKFSVQQVKDNLKYSNF